MAAATALVCHEQRLQLENPTTVPYTVGFNAALLFPYWQFIRNHTQWNPTRNSKQWFDVVLITHAERTGNDVSSELPTFVSILDDIDAQQPALGWTASDYVAAYDLYQEMKEEHTKNKIDIKDLIAEAERM